MQTRIREAEVADVDVIVRHRRGMFADMGHGDEAARDVMAAATRTFLEAALRNGSYRGWLVEDGEAVVAGGGVAILGFQPTPLDARPQRLWVMNLYTEPAYRKRGLARELMQRIIAWCRQE